MKRWSEIFRPAAAAMPMLLRRLRFVLAALVATAGCDSTTEPYRAEPRIEATTATGLSGTVGTDVAVAPTVLATDQFGTPLPGVTITFVVGADDGTIANPSVETDPQGLATVGTWTLGTKAGAQTVTAGGSGLVPVKFVAAATAGPVSRVAWRGNDSQWAHPGTALARPLSLRLADVYGNAVAGAAVAFTVISGAGTIDDGVLTDSYGTAESGPWTLGPATGVQQVRAQADSLRVEFTAFAVAPAPTCASSPDCGKIVFVSTRDGNGEIYSVNPDGSDLTRLTNHPASDGQPAWSPDGQRIAFVSNRGGSVGEVYVMNVDGSDVVRRTNSARGSQGPSWSPDGTKIVYSTLGHIISTYEAPFDGGDGGVVEVWSSELWVASPDANGPGPTPLFEAPQVSWVDEPAWSPDGTRLSLMIRSSTGAYNGVYDVAVINADGSGFQLLSAVGDDVDYLNPTWSPDGGRIAITMVEPDSIDGHVAHLGVMNSDGSGLAPLFSVAVWGHSSWSPDGQLIAFDSDGNIGWVRADGSDWGLIVHHGSDPDWRR